MSEKSQKHLWPQSKFYFLVNWGEVEGITFQEVSGLEFEPKLAQKKQNYRPVGKKFDLPGIIENSIVTLKKGICENDSVFWEWFQQIKMNTIERHDVEIKLVDESGKSTMTWTLANAWPSKINSTDLKSDGKEILIESIEIAYESLSISN